MCKWFYTDTGKEVTWPEHFELLRSQNQYIQVSNKEDYSIVFWMINFVQELIFALTHKKSIVVVLYEYDLDCGGQIHLRKYDPHVLIQICNHQSNIYKLHTLAHELGHWFESCDLSGEKFYKVQSQRQKDITSKTYGNQPDERIANYWSIKILEAAEQALKIDLGDSKKYGKYDG